MLPETLGVSLPRSPSSVAPSHIPRTLAQALHLLDWGDGSPPRGDSENSGTDRRRQWQARQKPHLAFWHGGEAEVPIGDEGVLHCVHSETVEGGLGAHILLEAFDHSPVESGPNRGPSASRWSHHTVFVLPSLGFCRACPQASVQTVPLPRAAPVLVASPIQPIPTPPGLKGWPVKWAHLALGAPSPLACGTHAPIFRVCLHVRLCPDPPARPDGGAA